MGGPSLYSPPTRFAFTLAGAEGTSFGTRPYSMGTPRVQLSKGEHVCSLPFVKGGPEESAFGPTQPHLLNLFALDVARVQQEHMEGGKRKKK